MKTAKKILSPFPYYGGKARMCGKICSLLDYDTTDLYIEPFGGGCRTLLNKQRHTEEIYNDFSYGLTTFFGVMQDEDKFGELIKLLQDNPPTEESFNRLVLERMEDEDRLNTSTNARTKSILLSCRQRVPHRYFDEGIKALNHVEYEAVVDVLGKILSDSYCLKILEPLEELQLRGYYKIYADFWRIVKRDAKRVERYAAESFDREWKKDIAITKETAKLREKHRKDFIKQAKTGVINSYTDDILNANESGSTVTDVRMAFIIFQLYYSSRDGMGTAWSDEKNRDLKAYYRAVNNLYRIADRLRDVVITQVDALDLVRQYRTDEGAMIYLDPSYLKPEDEHRNLGTVYKMSYTYEDHERLLGEIAQDDTKAKIIISNYDVELYNEYLTGWTKEYFRTTTGVGGRKNNRRVEVLWKNY